MSTKESVSQQGPFTITRVREKRTPLQKALPWVVGIAATVTVLILVRQWLKRK